MFGTFLIRNKNSVTLLRNIYVPGKKKRHKKERQ